MHVVRNDKERSRPGNLNLQVVHLLEGEKEMGIRKEFAGCLLNGRWIRNGNENKICMLFVMTRK